MPSAWDWVSMVQDRLSKDKTYKDKNTKQMPHLIRMHLIGDPSAPGNLKGKQWTEYIPGWMSSSFNASTRMIS